MNHFEYREGELWCERVRLGEVAATVGTPAYVYSTATLERHYRVFRDALALHPALGEPLIAYAVKANPNISVIATLARLGAGADTVSQGEIRRAIAGGVAAHRIVFSGVGKSGEELAFAIEVGVGRINVESEAELELIAKVAAQRGARQRIALRVNPAIEAGGHVKISTAAEHSKFGLAIADAPRLYARAALEPALEVDGLACHIGSQITDLEPLRQAYAVVRDLVVALREEGRRVASLDLGGGLGVPYFNQPAPPDPADFAAMAAVAVGGLGLAITVEPGRVIAANAGVLIASVVRVNVRPDGRRFAVVDAAMNDLLRPAMYEAFHDIRPVVTRAGATVHYDVVGPVCESGDTFARDRGLPPLAAGDLIAFMTAGAYGSAMASEYNSRLLVPEVLVNDAAFAVIRPRPDYDVMLARERRAPWL